MSLYAANRYPVNPYHTGYASPTASYLEMARIGAVVGLCGAAAANLQRLRRGEIQRGDALADTARVAVASGLATGAATLIANQFRSPMLSLLATVATGTAVMVALNTESPSGETR